MKRLACPHCGAVSMSVSKVPKEVVVVLPCPVCGELVVSFRGRTVALKREILENGTFEARKHHLAEVIAEFLEAGLLPLMPGEPLGAFEEGAFHDTPGQPTEDGGEGPRSKGKRPISQREVDHFVTIELSKIDNAHYFRKHFG